MERSAILEEEKDTLVVEVVSDFGSYILFTFNVKGYDRSRCQNTLNYNSRFTIIFKITK